mmetsp:Transcript_32480/g.48082  ORF Transcript_32480/g.48082 Transcript_32480/m.48082 type:complete len:309 (+) Transcript_32480:143-1069(+)
MASSESYEVFASVDKLVSKAVVGSDGAASWQEFRKETKGLSSRESVAPALQVKRSDRLGTGLATIADERANEAKIRLESGESALGSGYTTFKRKNDAEEAKERKRRRNIEKKIRPNDKSYFKASSTFDGWRFDYVFTTRDRGTGYYWDGTDSLKKLNGELDVPETTGDDSPEESNNNVQAKQMKKKKNSKHGEEKKKETEKAKDSKHLDSVSALDQVAEAIKRRNERLQRPPRGLVSNDVSLSSAWESAKDSTSGKTYYFNRETGKQQWDPPDAQLPEGWKSAKDSRNGKIYYYHTNGQTTWEVPKAN